MIAPGQEGFVVYLVRHGETLATRERRYEGRGDGGLTEEGFAQSRLAADTLAAAAPVDAVYSSSRLRARQTAEVIASRFGVSPHIMRGLDEANFGLWEGLTLSEIHRGQPDLLKYWLLDPIRSRPPEGESLAEVWVRVRACLDEICAARQSAVRAGEARGAAAVITHGGPIRAALSYRDKGDLSAFWDYVVKPGEVITFLAQSEK